MPRFDQGGDELEAHAFLEYGETVRNKYFKKMIVDNAFYWVGDGDEVNFTDWKDPELNGLFLFNENYVHKILEYGAKPMSPNVPDWQARTMNLYLKN